MAARGSRYDLVGIALVTGMVALTAVRVDLVVLGVLGFVV